MEQVRSEPSIGWPGEPTIDPWLATPQSPTPMPLVNHAKRELHVKVVYYGPGLGGKTTNLEHIHRHSSPKRRGKLISLMGESERTLFFDLLPVDLGTLKGYTVRLHLCTVPGQIARDATRRLVLRHVDGVVLVVDSQPGFLDANLASIRNLHANLALQGGDPNRVPLVVQFNKRDLDNALPVEDLIEALNIPSEVEKVEASALEGWGVFDTLKRITKGCLRLVGDPKNLPEGRSPSILPAQRASMYRFGTTAEPVEVRLPKAPALPRFEDEG